MIQLLYLFYFCGGGENDMYIQPLEQVYLNVYIKPIELQNTKRYIEYYSITHIYIQYALITQNNQ